MKLKNTYNHMLENKPGTAADFGRKSPGKYCLGMKFFKFSFVLLVCILGHMKGDAQQKPNVLCLVLEDTSPNFIGCYGNNYAQTPAIDSIAKIGIRFTNAFSTGTVCAPSRSCLITGVKTYQLGTGNHRSNYQIPDSIHGFPSFLRKEGYYTTNNAKTDYNTSAEKRIIQESWNESSSGAGWWKRNPGQPFFAVFNFMESHEARTAVLPYEKYQKLVVEKLPPKRLVREGELPLPPFLKDSPALRKEYARIYNSISQADYKVGEVLQRLKRENLMDSTIIIIYADHGEAMPRGKTNGIDLGYRVPFIIYIPPMYRSLSPWGPGGGTSAELICFEDLAPTIINLVSGKTPGYLKGRVLMGAGRSKQVDRLFLSQDRSDQSADLVRSVTDGRYMYSRNYMNFLPETRYMKYHDYAEIQKIIRKDFKDQQLSKTQQIGLVPRPAEYLFDVERDNWEIDNLADKSAYKSLLMSMRIKADSSILASMDIHFLPEYEMAEINKSVALYDFRKDAQKYPLSRIYSAAKLSGFQGKSIEHQQVKFLSDTNKIVRFWASMGLRCQKKLAKRTIGVITKAMDDPYPPVQILASAICYDNSRAEKAKKVLIQYARSSNVLLQVAALQQITYMNYGADFLDTIIQLKKTVTNVDVANTLDILLYKFKDVPLAGL